MQHNFDELVNSYIDNNSGISENFISITLAGQLKDNLNDLVANNKLRNAGTGNDILVECAEAPQYRPAEKIAYNLISF